MTLVTCLTICVKFDFKFKIAALNLRRYNYLKFYYPKFEDLSIIQESKMFDAVIAAIYATGFTSICLFFLMKKFNVASALPSDKKVSFTYSTKQFDYFHDDFEASL